MRPISNEDIFERLGGIDAKLSIYLPATAKLGKRVSKLEKWQAWVLGFSAAVAFGVSVWEYTR